MFKKDRTRQKGKADKLKGHEVAFIFSTAPKRGVKEFPYLIYGMSIQITGPNLLYLA